MKIPITKDLVEICYAIISEAKSVDEWAAIESDDMFQRGDFVGGFDANERAFCFSYYDAKKKEYWFQFGLDDAKAIAAGSEAMLDGRIADQQSPSR